LPQLDARDDRRADKYKQHQRQNCRNHLGEGRCGITQLGEDSHSVCAQTSRSEFLPDVSIVLAAHPETIAKLTA
jgi:uncharacterized protein YgiB involved in biofilm formation